MYLPNNNIFFITIYVCGAVGMDIWNRKIPNQYIIGGIISVFLVGEFKEIFIQIILLSIFVLPLYSIHVLGAGDLKLLCVLAGGISALFAMKVLIQALIFTAIATVVIKIISCIGRSEMRIKKFPFTLPILLALLNQVWG